MTATLTKPQSTALLTIFPQLRRRRLTLAVLAGLLTVTAFVTSDLVTVGRVQVPSLVIPAVTTALLAVLQLGAPWLQTARAAEWAGVGVATTWTFTPAGLTARSEHGVGEIGWDRVEDLRRSPDVVAMLLGPERCATGFGVQVLDDAQFARVSQWWRLPGEQHPHLDLRPLPRRPLRRQPLRRQPTRGPARPGTTRSSSRVR